MAKLRYYREGDLIKTKKWKYPFTVMVVYRGWVVAVNRTSPVTLYLFIKTYDNEVYYGSAKFAKYGIKNKEDIINYLDDLAKGNILLDKEDSTSVSLLLEEEEFIKNGEARHQL